MPNIKSAIKRVRVNEKRRTLRKAQTSALRSEIKKALNAVQNADEGAKQAVERAQKRVAQAAAKGLLHKNTAARRKSRLARALNRQG